VSAPDWAEVKELLHRAVALSPELRLKFLDEVCASNLPLRRELESLLSVEDELGADFMQSPPQLKAMDKGADTATVEFGSPGLEAGQLFAERFLLIHKLGEGGMGQVWLAEQTVPVRRSVALKLIRAGMYDEGVVRRFQSERQSLAIMDHPAIAKVFDAGATPLGQPYLVMEYVPGLPITEYCDHRKLKIRPRLELFIRACEGVQHAHQKAIIHRDLKPANILIVEVDGEPKPRVIDFGLAKATTAPQTEETLHTRFGQFLGTPGYMSPEQVDPNTKDIDTRTDVYSLGVILYVLLTGLQPFETKRREKSPLDVWLRQLREEEPPSPSSKLGTHPDTLSAASAARGTQPKQLASELRGDLDWIAMKALERDRERRYGTPAELIADLRRFLNHEPVLARPVSAAYQLGKFVRRHRIAALVAAMVTILAIVASGAALITVRQKREAQYQATQALQAQFRLLTQAAAQRLKDGDLAGARGIILEVLISPRFAPVRNAAAFSVFQDVRAADVELGALSGHGDRVKSAAYSPDGTHIVTASWDKTARAWDARTGAQQLVLSGHDGYVESAVYSPDGTRIVTASWDKTARVWDARTGVSIAVLSGHEDSVMRAAYSADGTRIVTASQDRTARIWDAVTGLQRAALVGHGDSVISAAYSPDDTRIVTASEDRTARVWDAQSAAPIAVLSGHTAALICAVYSPDGSRILTTSADRTARIWDARSAKPLAVLADRDGFAGCAAYSRDGARIISPSSDKTVRIWDARSGEQIGAISGQVSSVYAATYSPDGTRIVTASFDGTARLWDVRRSEQLISLPGHVDGVYSATYSADGTRIVTASGDKTARIWDAHTGAQLGVLSGHAGGLMSAAFSSDGARVVTSSDDRTARLWDVSSGRQIGLLSGHVGPVETGAYSPDGTRVLTASDDGTARIWDAGTGAQIAVLAGRGDVLSAAYSPDGIRIVTASRDKTAKIWDSGTGAQLAVLSGHRAYVLSAAYSPDGTRIVTASRDRTVRIWDAISHAQLATLSGGSAQYFSAAYSPDGTRIVTAADDKTARIWDARTGEQLAALVGHDDVVYFAEYSPDGTRIVTASADNTARVWDARVPANIASQILWAAAAETDPLSDVDRSQLGLPADSRGTHWAVQGSACDQAAAAFYDPDRLAPGALIRSIAADVADPACAEDIAKQPHNGRSDYQMGRTLAARGDSNGARQQFETAVVEGYRAARVDLADLLVDSPTNTRNLDRAASYYDSAWRDGVPIAAFRLGHLYENGYIAPGTSAGGGGPHAPSKAWQWYGKGADLGEPHALARFAEREEADALAQYDLPARNPSLLRAFEFYAAAAERAREESWPDDAWKYWRCRRATLARLLAQDGMMLQVAEAYAAVIDRARMHSPASK
jgi:eukaryotic-like serine/threonine-protein kinase